jgi:hypothetical protein
VTLGGCPQPTIACGGQPGPEPGQEFGWFADPAAQAGDYWYWDDPYGQYDPWGEAGEYWAGEDPGGGW